MLSYDSCRVSLFCLAHHVHPGTIHATWPLAPPHTRVLHGTPSVGPLVPALLMDAFRRAVDSGKPVFIIPPLATPYIAKRAATYMMLHYICKTVPLAMNTAKDRFMLARGNTAALARIAHTNVAWVDEVATTVEFFWLTFLDDMVTASVRTWSRRTRRDVLRATHISPSDKTVHAKHVSNVFGASSVESVQVFVHTWTTMALPGDVWINSSDSSGSDASDDSDDGAPPGRPRLDAVGAAGPDGGDDPDDGAGRGSSCAAGRGGRARGRGGRARSRGGRGTFSVVVPMPEIAPIPIDDAELDVLLVAARTADASDSD